MRIAIVGAGIAGLGTAWLLTRQGHPVTLFEANDRLGGHTATVDVTVEGQRFPVDTGFLVFNDRTYPRLIALFEELGVPSVASEMSFSCRVDRDGLEWAGTNLRSLFAQPGNALRPRFWRMLSDIARFNRDTVAMASGNRMYSVSLGEFLEAENYSAPFRDWYLLPMAAAIWSSPKRDILDFPLPTFVNFCRNHGLLQITDRPQWRTVAGGGRVYVEKIAAHLSAHSTSHSAAHGAAHLTDIRVRAAVRRVLRTPRGVEIDSCDKSGEVFDGVVLACHSDQALALLGDPSHSEQRLLSTVRYQPNRVVLHTDAALLPRARCAWSAWNYLAVDDPTGQRPVAVSYLINKLQPLPIATPVIVTLNPPFEPDPAHVIEEFEYSHPLLDSAAISAQSGIAQMQGHRHTWYAGAWLGYGFHEDGLASAHAVADSVAQREKDFGRVPLPVSVAA